VRVVKPNDTRGTGGCEKFWRPFTTSRMCSGGCSREQERGLPQFQALLRVHQVPGKVYEAVGASKGDVFGEPARLN